MREALRPLEGQRISVTSTVRRFGCRPLFADLYAETVMLEGVTTDTGDILTEHLWLPIGARLAALELRKGDVVTLTARVRHCTKRKLVQRRNGKYAYTRASLDFKLVFPTRVQKLTPTTEGVSA